MKASSMGIRGLAARTGYSVATGALAWGVAAQAFAQEKLGQPTPGAIDLQRGVTPLRADAIWFHNVILLPVITVISLFVLALLVICVVRFNKRANPVPAKWSHNTPIEIVWTVVPVLILATIAIFSFRLLFNYHSMPGKPDYTVKVTGYQWYWGYEYPDQKIPEIISNILPEDEAKAKGVPFRLAATQPMVVPVNKIVRVLVTGNDVIHSFAVPSFGIISDAIPGKVNETWFKAEQTGVFYGSCRELCGIDHAFMPIEVHVVSQADFDAWVASKAKPSAPAPAPAVAAAATPTAAPAAATVPAATNAPAPAAAPAAKK
jgi:cytochrome c oxidase subunit 2